MDKKDCFAYRERNGHSGCKALNKKNCKDCKFYRNDRNQFEIEQSIKEYAKRYI